MGKHSIYTKLVLFGCILCIVPVLALGFFSYMKSAASIQRHVDQSNIQLMRQSKDNMELVLRTVDYTLNYVINTKQMQEALYRNLTYYDFQFYNELKQELTLLQSPDTKVTDVILANSDENWVISNRGLYAFDDYESRETLAGLMELEGSTGWVLLETEAIGSSDTLSYACPYTMALVKKMPLHTANKRGVALATIPTCSLAEAIGHQGESREMMVLDQDLRIIAHPDRSRIGMSLTEAEDLRGIDPSRIIGASGQFETALGNRHISVTHVRSDFNGWVYLSFTEIAAIKRESRQIGWFTFYVCGVVILFSVLFVWLGSRRVYTPIRKIFQNIAARLPESKGAVKNELQLIDEHIRELFASNTKLRHELQRHSQQLRTLFLHKLFQGQLAPSEIREKLEQYGFSRQAAAWDHLAVVTLQIDLLGQTRYEQGDLDLLLFAITNIIEEMVPPADRLPPVIIDQTQVTLIGRGGITREEFNAHVYKLTENIQQNMRKYLDLDVSIGISLPFQSLMKASRAYQEGIEALKHRLKLGKGVIVPYFSLNFGQHSHVYFYPMLLQNELIDAIKLADEAKALEMFGKWLEEVFRKDRAPQEYQISFIRLLNDLMIVMQEAGIRLDRLNLREGSLYEELLQLYVRTEIRYWFESRVIRPMIRVFRERQESQYQNISEQIIEIIRNEYDTDLTLESVASRLHYNTFYLSSVFKKETRMSFSDYLTQYRLNMSKRWLIETDMPIKEIAERLTYNNPQNFIRSFRKLEGMTPGQYRSKYAASGG